MSKKPGRVLLVDDDESFRRVQGFKLEQAGYEVTSCADGMIAIDSFGEGSHDVVVTDIRMPGISGLELLGRVSCHGQNRRTCVLIASIGKRHPVDEIR